MTQDQFNQWLIALRSGKFTQAQRTLESATYQSGIGITRRYCCLGVLSKLHNITEGTSAKLAYPAPLFNRIHSVVDSIYKTPAVMLMELNDSKDCHHYNKVIAELESEPEYWITER